MPGRQSPAVIKHPSGAKKRCASNRRYAVVYVRSVSYKWNQRQQAYVRFASPVQELVVERRSDNLKVAREVQNKLRIIPNAQPIIWDLLNGEVVS